MSNKSSGMVRLLFILLNFIFVVYCETENHQLSYNYLIDIEDELRKQQEENIEDIFEDYNN